MQKILMIISVIAVIVLAVLNLTYSFDEPDEVFPMCNQRITWEK